MKTLIILFSAFIFSMPLFAQESEEAVEETPVAAPSHQCYMKKDGKMYHCTMGKKTDLVTAAITLENGTTISKSGTVVKDGKKKVVTEGKCVDMDGNVLDFKTYHAEEKKRMKEEEKKNKG